MGNEGCVKKLKTPREKRRTWQWERIDCRRADKYVGRERGRKNVGRDGRGAARREQQRDSVAAREFAHPAGFHGLTPAVHADALLG